MAKLKYAPLEIPLKNEHAGFTFQPNNYGQSMFPASRNNRARYKHQHKRQHNNQKAVINWRNMSAATKAAWNLFAATYPQPSKRDPNKFLTGYQLFIKRNSYCFLNHGITSDYMYEPVLSVSPGKNITFEITTGDVVIDCTEEYIKNFGLLPEIGDKILLYAVIYGEDNGNFYEPVHGLYTVQNVYIDGLFVSVTVPSDFDNITVSLYLSYKKKSGVQYPGTKCRYMGCFTTKKFIQLQDVFNTYVDKRKQIVIINEDEDGLTSVDAQSLFQTMIAGNCGTIIYDENDEWVITDTITTIDLEFSVQPFSKELSIQIESVFNAETLILTAPETLSVADYKSFGLFLMLGTPMESTQSLHVQFSLLGTNVSDKAELTFSKSTVSSYQSVLALFSALNFTDTEFDVITITFSDTSGLVAFPVMQIDYISLYNNETGITDNCLDKYVVGFEYDETNEKFIIYRNNNLQPLEVEFALPSAGNAFNPITVSGEDDVEADSSAESLEFVAGTNIEILTDNTNKKITFNVDYSIGGIRGQSSNNYAPASYWYVQVPFPLATSIYCFRKFVLGAWYSGLGTIVIEGYVIRKNTSGDIDVKVIYDSHSLGVTWTKFSTYVRIFGGSPGTKKFRQEKHYYYSGDGQ